MRRVFVMATMVGCLAGAPGTLAQEVTGGTPPPALEIHAGWSAFVDESLVDHTVLGGAARFHLSRHVSLGPEIAYMIGPAQDRDLFVTGNLWLDLAGGSATRPLTPFVVVGGGFMRHSNSYPWGSFAFTEWAYTAGVGARLRLADRWYATVEARVGWEPHVRIGASVGYRLGGDRP